MYAATKKKHKLTRKSFVSSRITQPCFATSRTGLNINSWFVSLKCTEPILFHVFDQEHLKTPQIISAFCEKMLGQNHFVEPNQHVLPFLHPKFAVQGTSHTHIYMCMYPEFIYCCTYCAGQFFQAVWDICHKGGL